MAKKTIKNTLLAAIITAVLCVGTVSAHQLSLNAQTTTCRGFCTKNFPCPNILGCGCVIPAGFTSGVCNFVAAKPAQ